MGGWDGLGSALMDPVAVGIILALVLGKPVGIMGTTWLLTETSKARLDGSFKWMDVLGVSLLAGIGFTISLLLTAPASPLRREREFPETATVWGAAGGLQRIHAG
ncbi:Na+/H+ antiporter NhaA [Arthrobacter sp. UYNi723]